MITEEQMEALVLDEFSKRPARESFFDFLMRVAQKARIIATDEELRALKSQQDAAIESKAAEQSEPVAWQVRRSDGRIDGIPILWENCTKDLYDATLETGRYAGYENAPRCEVRALCTSPQTSQQDAAIESQRSEGKSS